MDCIQIQGGCPLRGEVRIQGSKNAVLPILAACVLVPGVTVLKNCPDISDVACMCQLLRHVGARVDKQQDALIVDASAITSCHLPAEYVTRMRSSVILAGAMLGRCREIHLYYPGGCVIGDRPIDMHISALEQMGVQFTEEDGGLRARAVSLCGTKIDLPFPSVGATENVLLAAVLARGVTKICGCATEPEIVALCRFLQGAGARIGGVGTDCLTVEGVPRLSESCCLVEADRIVAGTYLLGVLSAGPAGTAGERAESRPSHGGADLCLQGRDPGGKKGPFGVARRNSDGGLSGISHGSAVAHAGGAQSGAGRMQADGNHFQRPSAHGERAEPDGSRYPGDGRQRVCLRAAKTHWPPRERPGAAGRCRAGAGGALRTGQYGGIQPSVYRPRI